MYAMKEQRKYVMQDQVHHKVAAIMDDRASQPGNDKKELLFTSLLVAALIVVQTLLSASTA